MMVLPNVQSPLVGPARQAAMNLLSFLGASPTPFHAVRTAADKLETAGFKRVSEQDNWEDTIVEGGRYYFTRLVRFFPYVSVILPAVPVLIGS
jgi:hypothetical protein